MIRRLLFFVVLVALVGFIYLQFSMPSLPAPALSVLAHWSPRAAVRGFLDAAKAEDEERMKDFASRASQDFTSMASIVKELKEDWSVGDDFEEDGRARVRVEQGGTEAVAITVKEEGGWKVDLVSTGAEMMKAALKKKK
jgi:hypothetical protein